MLRAAPPDGSDAKGVEFFERKIRPLLANTCYQCHSRQSKKTKGGLLLDSQEGLLKGGDSGPILVTVIATVVWLLAAADSRRLTIIAIPTYIVGLAGLTHVIAGSIEMLFLVMIGEVAWTHYLVGYFMPALIGNILGGVALVSVLNHAQVISGR